MSREQHGGGSGRRTLTLASGASSRTSRETLVLVPGLLCDATVWTHQIAALGTRFDIKVPDLTGCTSIDEMADLVLGGAPGRFSVAGHSMGARVALQVVARAPDRVRRLCLLDTGTHPRQPGEAEKRQHLLEIAQEKGMQAMAELWLPPMVKEGALEANNNLRQDLFAMVSRMSPEIHRNQIAALLGRPDARAGLAAIRCPVLVGVGAHDAWSPPHQHEEIAAAIPGADYVIFPDGGHMAPMEAPEAVTVALSDWMSKKTV